MRRALRAIQAGADHGTVPVRPGRIIDATGLEPRMSGRARHPSAALVSQHPLCLQFLAQSHGEAAG